MRPNLRWFPRLISTLLALALLAPVSANAQQVPRSVTVAANPPGTVFYALASGMAKVVSAGAPFQMVVQPYTGTSTFLPLLNTGEIDFGVNNAVDMALSYQGPERLKIGGRNPFAHTPNVRLVMRGSVLMVGLLARKDSGIRTIYDVKGKRLTGEYPAQLSNWYNLFAFLATGSMTWNDVKVVPVPAVNEGVDALVQGRADVAMHALNSAKIREADAAVGVRHVSLDCSPEGEKRLRNAVPGYYPRWLKPGQALAIVEDTCVNAYDIYLTTHKAAPDKVVNTVLKGIWDNVDKLPPFHPSFKEWTRERAVTPEVTIPYHPAAIQVFKEQRVWSANMDEAQRKLLSLNP
ncbi:MAG: TAXI family TRAP transporter solute-binding subunit [Deltaproteobacteria bacterium]|nr:TAXI family TRAP transporter solute-binding subunit [Deltaproteobacteria bacterium]